MQISWQVVVCIMPFPLNVFAFWHSLPLQWLQWLLMLALMTQQLQLACLALSWRKIAVEGELKSLCHPLAVSSDEVKKKDAESLEWNPFKRDKVWTLKGSHITTGCERDQPLQALSIQHTSRVDTYFLFICPQWGSLVFSSGLCINTGHTDTAPRPRIQDEDN